ncbi:MAG TPA: fumarate reductase (quinol) flavoprotein subunit [Burkholderiales bacterium]|nr:fumarate reductase (quinol) flavoprotein subunit [Burkholderiales bacterium]
MQSVQTDVVVVGGGGAGLRAAIAVAESDPRLRVALVSKVVPMRSHTVAAEGGSAGVIRTDDSLDHHFDDTVGGSDWLCDQDVVEYFVAHCTEEMVQLEHWGCPWSRKDDGHVNVRFFGGMKVQRTWFAADKTGFHMLHTLFQTSHKYSSIKRFDEYFCADLVVEDGRVQGVVAIEVATGEFFLIECKAAIICTGGAGRVFGQNTNAGIVTGDGMGIAYRHGVPLRDMEFVQWHPTALPGTGVLITEGCRGEGGILTNKDGYRYLQDYGLGPPDPWPRPKAMELGPRDRLSQAFWHEEQKGRTVATALGNAVWLDLRHLGAAKIHERLPMITEVAKVFAGVDPVVSPIPVRPAVHYTMGGILCNGQTETPLKGLYAAGECSSVGIHGANRLGSNSLAEIVVFGKVAGERAAQYVKSAPSGRSDALHKQASAVERRLLGMLGQDKGDRVASIRDEMHTTMETGVGIFRKADSMQVACSKLATLRDRLQRGIKLDDRNRVFNTEWLSAIELGFTLEIAEVIAQSALHRKESRGAHTRLDEFKARDDANFLKHTLAYRTGDGPPRLEYAPVTITKSPPKTRTYGGEGKKVELT